MSEKISKGQKWRQAHPEENRNQNRIHGKTYRQKHKDDENFKLRRKLADLKHRLKKKEQMQKIAQESSGIAYENRNTLIKAKNKVNKALPDSKLHPAKRRAVLQEFSSELSLHSPPQKKHKVQALSREKQIARDFYLKDSVSVVLPNKKDVKTFNIDGQKVQLNTRVLQGPMREIFSDFKTQNPSITIGKSTFATMKPPNVKFFKDMPQFSCVCVYHTNYRHLFDAAKKFLKDENVKTYQDLIDSIVCSKTNFECMTGLCKNCTNVSTKISSSFTFPDQNSKVKFRKWRNVNKKWQEDEIEMTFKDFFKEFVSKTIEFKFHSYINNVQAHQFEEDCKKFNAKRAILVINFSEKFLCVPQDEIQASHFNHENYTLFTAALYIPNLSTLTMDVKSYAVISDKDKQDKFSVFSFINTIIKELKENFPHVEFVKIWSDGAASQFKSCFTISTLNLFRIQFNMAFYWLFFASCHGKSIVDGIGATIKQAVSKRIKVRRIEVKSAYDFYIAARDSCPNINVRYVSDETVSKDMKILNPTFGKLEKKSPFNNIRKRHYFESIGDDSIKYSTSCLQQDNFYASLPSFNLL